MNERPIGTSTPGTYPSDRCEECGAFCATEFGELLLCSDCYVGKASCCSNPARTILENAARRPRAGLSNSEVVFEPPGETFRVGKS